MSESAAPVRAAGPLDLSGSAIDGIGQCALRWFLSREAGGATATTTAIGFGNVLHVLAQQVADGVLAPDVPALLEQLDSVWSQLRFGAAWVSAREREQAEAALRRFVAWHQGSARRLVASEHTFKVTVQVAGESVVLRGAMDRVEVDTDGAVVVVDLKTGKTTVTGEQVKQHAQLGVYQLAVAHGAVDEVVGQERARPGGAELVFLRQEAGRDAPDTPKVRAQDSWRPGEPDEPTAPEQQVERAVHSIREERFDASTNTFCTMCEFRSLCPAQSDGLFVLSPMDEVVDDAG